MSTVPLIGTGLGYKSLTVNAQSRLNVYLEQQKDNDKGPIAIYGRPGLVEVADYSPYAIRGLSLSNRDELMVWRNAAPAAAPEFVVAGLYIYAPHNTAALIATPDTSAAMLGGSSLYDIATDGTTTIVAGRGAIGGTDASVLAYIPSVALYSVSAPTIATGVGTGSDVECVGFSDDYFVAALQDSNSFYFMTAAEIAAAAPDITSATSFLTAYTFSDPILRLKGKNGYLMVFGGSAFEAWQAVPSADAPFQPVKGLAQRWGLAAKYSLAETQSGFMFIGRDATGSYHICKLVGASITPVMDHEFDAFLLDMAKAGTLSDAIGCAVAHQGHLLYFLSFPSAGKSWMFDANTDTFSVTQTGDDAFIGTISVGWGGQQYIAGSNGKLYRFDDQTYADGDTHMPRAFVTRHFWKDHDRLTVDALRVDFETGVGLVTGQGDDPQIMLSISRDNGKTWGNEYWTTLGAIGNYYTRAEWRRLGSGRDFLFKIRITDPVKFAISGMSIRAQPLGT